MCCHWPFLTLVETIAGSVATAEVESDSCSVIADQFNSIFTTIFAKLAIDLLDGHKYFNQSLAFDLKPDFKIFLVH